MAAYAALASLMNNIEQMMKHPHLCNSFNHKQIQTLLQKSGFLLGIIEVNQYDGGSKEAEDFERRITSAAHAAEDIIETHIVDQIHAGACATLVDEDVSESDLIANDDEANDDETCYSFLLSVKNKVAEWVRRIASAAHTTQDVTESHVSDQIHAGPAEQSVGSRADLQSVIEDVEAQIRAGPVEQSVGSRADLQGVIEDMEALIGRVNEVMKIEREEHEKLTHSTLPLMEISGGEPATAMVGLEDELTRLLGELTGHQSNRRTISIVGMGGMGKTTLARNIYANPLIVEHFDTRVWATISQQYNVEEILLELLSSLGKSTNCEVGEQLHKALIGKRYLVVLDDIWSVEAWDKLRRYFPDNGSSSRVLLTTRMSNVAGICGPSCLTMNLLDEGKSWELFCEKAMFPHKDDPLQLEDVGKEIVRLCKGLALSIVVIGGLLLKSPRTIEYWKNVAKKLKSSHNAKEKLQSLDVLSLSYRQLPPHLKPCFLYMGAFKEDSKIRVSTITRLWVAEGFIRPDGTRILEEIAEDCLKDLIHRNLIFISRRHCNGTIGSCGIHDLLRDLCIKVAEQQDFFHVREYGDIQTTDRLVVTYPNDGCIGFQRARSILMNTLFTEAIECELLRVLGYAINKYRNPPADDKLFGNVNLRYLAYQTIPSKGSSVGKLPASLPRIWNLQTITFHTGGILVVAPPNFWKMRQLRHIKCGNIYLPPPPMSCGEDVLENFQTLGTAVNLSLSEEVCKIIPNIKKLVLLYDPTLQGYNGSLEFLCKNVYRLQKLESLKMEIQPQAMDFELHKKLIFPSSLRKLSLSHCQLHWNDMEMIGSSPQAQLEVLHLNDLCVTKGERWSPFNGQFRHLKFLKIDYCNLQYLDADNTHFPVLEKLVLCYLEKLEEIPLDFGDIPTLGLIRLEYCKGSAAISAIRIKEYQQDLGNEALQIQIKAYESEEDFMKMVEAEQLTLTCIQFGGY